MSGTRVGRVPSTVVGSAPVRNNLNECQANAGKIHGGAEVSLLLYLSRQDMMLPSATSTKVVEQPSPDALLQYRLLSCSRSWLKFPRHPLATRTKTLTECSGGFSTKPLTMIASAQFKTIISSDLPEPPVERLYKRLSPIIRWSNEIRDDYSCDA